MMTDDETGPGYELRRLRERRGWTQTRLAVIAGLSVRTVRAQESGESLGTAGRVRMLEALGATREESDAIADAAHKAKMSRKRGSIQAEIAKRGAA